jgi:DNA-binding transcriptional LysR family regulator
VIIPRLDIRSLEALVAVADTGSFRGAARSLGYTQSAVSHQIASFEHRLGASLFVRPGGRGRVHLTPIGELAYRRAEQVLGAAHAFDSDMAAAVAGDRGTLRIGVSHGIGFLLAQPLARLRRHSPGIEVSLINAVSAESLAQQLAQGQIDIGLYLNVEPDERVITEPLFDDPWIILAHVDDPIARVRGVSLDVLHGADTIAWQQRWRSQAILEQVWQRRGIRPRIVYRTDDSLMIQRLVAAGLGRACLGRLSTGQLIEPDLRRISIDDELPLRTLSLCYSRQRTLSPATQVLIATIQEAVRPSYLAS